MGMRSYERIRMTHDGHRYRLLPPSVFMKLYREPGKCMQTRSGPKIPAAGHLEGEGFFRFSDICLCHNNGPDPLEGESFLGCKIELCEKILSIRFNFVKIVNNRLNFGKR